MRRNDTLAKKQNVLKESDLEEQVVAEFRKATGPIFVLQSSTNIDRIVTVYRAAKRSGRIFLQEVYMADVTSSIGGSIPNPRFNDVYAFITNPKRYDALVKYRRMGKERMARTSFVIRVRSSMLRYLQGLSKIMSFEGGLLIYSMWSGYRQQPEMSRFLKACEDMGLRSIILHANGHADSNTIKALIDRIQPTEIIPVHTENAGWFDNKTTSD